MAIGHKHENAKVQKKELRRSRNSRKMYLKAKNRFIMAPNFSCVLILSIAESLNLWSETHSKFNYDLRLNESRH